MWTRIALLALLLTTCASSPRLEQRLREGDIIFHESRSSQSRPIQLATKSRYSHLNEPVISPAAMFDSDELIEVVRD